MALFVAFAGFPAWRVAELCALEVMDPAFRGRREASVLTAKPDQLPVLATVGVQTLGVML